MNAKPNILLIMADQMRRDAVGVNRPEFAHTPHLDQLASEGINFTHAYTSCPSCIAARASLMTGLKQSRHGFTGYDAATEWRYPVTLAGTLAQAGYHTQCVGKMHVEPARALMGYHNVVLHDGFLHDKRRKYRDPIEYDDYLPDLRRELGPTADIMDDGPGCNGYAVRCWPWDERLHPTSWVTSKSIEFLRRRDPSKPFFLKVSYHRPHTPYDPPMSYFSMYDGRPMPPPVCGDWSSFLSTYGGLDCPIPREPFFIDRARRAYCALVTQIDFELNRLFTELLDLKLLDNTVILFLSDHGDMLYDHGVVRKSLPFEASAGIPLIIRLPQSLGFQGAGTVDSRTVELRDIFPTVCAMAGLPLPEDLDGLNLMDKTACRDCLHGEHAQGAMSNQWLTDGKEKYCWFSQSGRELLFDLSSDPQELHDLSAERPERIAFWRNRLVTELDGRPEGYVADGKLQVGRRAMSSLPWAGIGC